MPKFEYQVDDVYKVQLSSDSTVVKKLIDCVQNELNLEFQKFNDFPHCSEANTDFRVISEVLQALKNTEDQSLCNELEDEIRQKYNRNQVKAIKRFLEQYGDIYNKIWSSIAAVEINRNRFLFQLPDCTVDGAKELKKIHAENRNAFSMIFPDLGFPEPDTVAIEAEIKNKTGLKLKECSYIYVTFDNELSPKPMDASNNNTKKEVQEQNKVW